MRKIVFLDYASATPIDSRVLAAMRPYLTKNFYNPAAAYSLGRQARAEAVNYKKRIASQLGVLHSEIIMTSGGTESNNLAINGVMDKFPGKKLYVSSIEHESVLAPAQKYRHELLKVSAEGEVLLEQFDNISDDAVLISVIFANNEIGTVQPLAKISRKIRETIHRRKKAGNKLPLFFHTDACQAPLYLDINAHRLGVDLMTLNGGKIYGPRPCGVLFAGKNVPLSPQILGGGQQKNLRSGTETVAQTAGLAKALEIAARNRGSQSLRLSKLQQQFVAGLKKIYPSSVVNGSAKKRLPSNVNVTLPGIDNERLLFLLDEAGIIASAGSACAASSQKASHVLSALGLSEEQARQTIRFSMGHDTTGPMISRTLSALEKLTKI